MSPTKIEKAEKRKRDEEAPLEKVKKSKKDKKNKKDKEDKKDKKQKKEKKEKKTDDDSTAADESKLDRTASPATTAAEENIEILASYQYKENAELSALPQSTIDEFYKKHTIEITGDLRHRPILEFKYAGLPDNIMAVVKNFDRPTPVQAATWPISLSGRDIVGIAETGSGKTLAFTIPGLVHIATKLKQGKKNGKPSMLVVSPTRELAMQSAEQAEAAGKAVGVTSVCVYGGVDKQFQRKAFQRGVDIVVATPGRLIDLINEGSCDLSNVSFMVLDEADRMLDDGFENDIRAIMGYTPKDRQTLMFSATWPESVRKLASDFLNKPMRVTIGSPDLAASKNVEQIVKVIQNPRDKERHLLDLLKKVHKSRTNRVLIFALYKKEAMRIERSLEYNGFKVVGIHGDKNQQQRTQALNSFKDGSYPLMIATDVAARGLDIPDVEYVINLTFPLTIEAYVHRIGRTGRGGKKGVAYTFFTPEDKAHSGELINVLKEANMKVPDELMAFGTTVKKKTHSAYGAFFKDTSGVEAKKPTKIIFD
ncbi:P-loop containing nucleoside triphosphate hydrolase protein [Mycotypha africana]|uniref:P-loop containing nucleoside triphosphate hydrolase protein n=1 Tax=Mycotypha africana TaxID=64632 RepID=UPI00230157EE|nr:P-loop containing nucleoside triphosphate hydrolase protein [Mycotypha africana]KAI8979840.1 P-loop containing nucleoside triphosphate hydrolase protein [Mycotypha africana]